MLIISIGCLFIILMILWSISNMYKEGFACSELQTKQCEDNEYVSQIQMDSTGKATQYKCCTDDSKLMQGKQGPKGEDGINGKDGINGATGPTGDKGPAGTIGPIGPMGDPGEKGKKGEKGKPGKPGEKGPIGLAGENGIIESSGKIIGDPIPGPKGPVGNMGPKGPTGPKGNDASPSALAPTSQGPQTGNEKLKEIQLQLIKALSAKPPPITQHVIIHEVGDALEEDNALEVGNTLEVGDVLEEDTEEIIDMTPSQAQGSEYSKATYKQPSYY